MSMRPRGAIRAALRQPALAALVLFVIYATLSLGLDPRGFLGTDTGAKVATLESMSQRDSFDPDVGYWAADLDPEGQLHPLYQTTVRGDGGWVAVSTLPVLVLARPLYELGGYRATLALPMLGAVGAAVGARALARRMRPSDDGWRTFWLVGLGSPIAVYALDFWEHSIGVACMLAAVALLLDVANGRVLPHAPAAGALLGVAAVLRNESLVYALVGVGVVLAVRFGVSRSFTQVVTLGSLAVVGFSVPWVANVMLERELGGLPRSTRTTGTASGFGQELSLRGKEALQTSLGLTAGEVAASVLLGVGVVIVLALGVKAAARGDRPFSLACVAGVACVYLFDAAGGLGFVPGMALAFPVVVAAVLWRPEGRAQQQVRWIALLALPIVYLFQFSGGAAPQWGGRYTLTSSILLGVVALATMHARVPSIAPAVAALTVGVTALGVAWLGVRSHGVASFFDEVIDEAEPVVISRNAFLIREGGGAVVGRRWLSVADEPSFRRAVDVARTVGEERFTVLEWGGDAPPLRALPAGIVELRRTRLTFVDVPVGLVTYGFAAPS